MTLSRLLGPRFISLLIWIWPVVALSACTTVVQTTLNAEHCFTRMVDASGLAKDTPHAPLPENDTAGAWVDYGNRESGQVDIANSDKRAITGIGKTCDAMAVEAQKKSEHKPFWKRVLG